MLIVLNKNEVMLLVIELELSSFIDLHRASMSLHILFDEVFSLFFSLFVCLSRGCKRRDRTTRHAYARRYEERQSEKDIVGFAVISLSYRQLFSSSFFKLFLFLLDAFFSKKKIPKFSSCRKEHNLEDVARLPTLNEQSLFGSWVRSLILIILIKKWREKKNSRERGKEIVSDLAYWGEIIRWIVLVCLEIQTRHICRSFRSEISF